MEVHILPFREPAAQSLVQRGIVGQVQGVQLKSLEPSVYGQLNLLEHSILIVQVFLPQEPVGIVIIYQDQGQWEHKHDQKRAHQLEKSLVLPDMVPYLIFLHHRTPVYLAHGTAFPLEM